jgi:anti-sigma regulatory factor (Ser/Thr protein kinase)
MPMRGDHESGIAVAVDDPSQIGEARRSANAVANAIGLSETEAGKFALIATEAATNISKHAKRGEIILRSVVGRGVHAADLIAIDSGPGITNLDRALGDGYSTAGTSGHGLGAMARLANGFDIFTTEGVGTVLCARIDRERPRSTSVAPAYEVGVVRVPKRGEEACGDDWSFVVDERGRGTLTVADGLGHGIPAAEAATRAASIGVERAADQPAMVVSAIHGGLRSTRGAAVAVAEITDSTIRYSGLGNISASIVGPTDSRSLVSHNGIAGHEMRKVQEFAYDWSPGSLLVVHSDGLSSRWDLTRYPGLFSRHPSVIAGVLYRDFSRGRDDALVVVVRAIV